MSAIQLPPGYIERRNAALASLGFVNQLYELVNPGTTEAYVQREMQCSTEVLATGEGRFACDYAEKNYTDRVNGAIERLVIISAVLVAVPVGVFIYRRKRKAG